MRKSRARSTGESPGIGAARHKSHGLPVQLGALMWLVQPLYLASECLTAAQVTVSYSLLDNTISDLGATTCTSIAYPFGAVPVCSPRHDLINISLVLSGVLLVLGAVLTRQGLPRSRMRTAAIWLWTVSGLSSIGTGLMPLDRNLDLHVLVSLPGLFAQPLAVLALGVTLRRSHPGIAVTSIFVGAVGLAAAVVFLARAGNADLGGFFERLALWPSYLWLAVSAAIVVRPSGSTATT